MIVSAMRLLLALLLTAFVATAAPAASDPAGSPDMPALQKAAKEGDAAAQFQLGRAYYRGNGVERDPQKALELIRKAADAGNPDAIDSMGFFYANGEIVQLDENQAVEWFRRGAEAGSARSKLNLGLLLRQGKTVQPSAAESLKLMEEAAAAGLPEAKSYLGQLYFNGDRHMKSDFAKAYPLVKEAAEAGDPACQNIMGVFCRDGLGVRQDFNEPQAREEAAAWFRKAAMKNNVKAQSNLAHLLGIGSPGCEDPEEALKWLIIAKDQGEITAKKTYEELFKTLPSALLVAARLEANRFSILEHAEEEARRKRGGAAGASTQVEDKGSEPASAKPAS
jgi:TPR repeat protein